MLQGQCLPLMDALQLVSFFERRDMRYASDTPTLMTPVTMYRAGRCGDKIILELFLLVFQLRYNL